MERILEKLVEAEDSGPANAADLNDLSSDDMNDVMKVLTGFDDYAEAVEEAEASAGKSIEDSFTSVQDMAKVVDKATLANERVLELTSRQEDLERTFHSLTKRINKLRCLHLGHHISDEISTLRDYCEKIVPPLPPPTMPPSASSTTPSTSVPSAANFRMPNLSHLRPPLNMPEGMIPPSVQLPTQPLPSTSCPPTLPTAPDVKVKEEIDNLLPHHPPHHPVAHHYRKPSVPSSAPKIQGPGPEDKQKAEEVLGQLSSNMRHMVNAYDSEATDSSSGGESCDEMDNFSFKNERSAPIKKRAKWTWLHNRSAIASKWTWLTAQISDLEYRIRQQTDFYRQIRAAKGAVTLGEPTISWPAHARKAVHDPGMEIPLSVKPPTRNYSKMDSTGRKIIIKELAPMAISPEELAAAANQNDDTFTACRTRPIKTLRRRRILGTLGLHRTSTRAAKESTVKCDCIRPGQWCSICFGRSNHIQAPDPLFQDKARTSALLDHSYHQVLSFKHDVPLELHMMQMIKNRSWLVSGAQTKAKNEALEDKKKKKLKRMSKDELLDSKNRKKIKRRESEGGPNKTKKIKSRNDKYRRKSVTVHHQDGTAMMDIGVASDDLDGSPLPSPANHHMSLAEQIRRKRETAFDIDNIVIPYSIAASTRVEKLKYKEILTPTWRKISENEATASEEAAMPQPLPPPPAPAPTPPVTSKRKRKSSTTSANKKVESNLISAEMAEVAASAAMTEAELANFEDISLSSYEARHYKAEVEEQKRWSQPLKVIGMGSGTNRNRSSRRQNSQADSGCNTPDPMSPGSVEKVDSVEVNTRPSTPDELSTPNAIKNRRRTSSITLKPRDRNPSEDSPRCPTPGTSGSEFSAPLPMYPQIDPYEPRKFPISDEDYTLMCEEMPSGFDTVSTSEGGGQPCEELEEPISLENVPAASVASTSNPVASSRRASSQESSNFDDEVQEMEDEDPDWSGDMEDPDDPEWTSREEVQQNNVKSMKKPPVKKPVAATASVTAATPPTSVVSGVQPKLPPPPNSQQQPPQQQQQPQQKCFNAN